MGVRSRADGPLEADERAVLAALVRELGPRLLAYVRRVYGCGDEAEDIVAETFCRAARHVNVLRGSDRQALYVLTIARNLCRDRLRRRSRPASSNGLDSAASPAADPGEAGATAEQVRALRAAVAALPEPLREVVVLRLSGGLTFQEIAELLHVPLGTALSRMHAALARLRAMLGGTDDC